MRVKRALPALRATVRTLTRPLVRGGPAGRSAMIAAIVFLIFGIGIASFQGRDNLERGGDARPAANGHAGSASEAIARLEDYSRSLGPQDAGEKSTSELLPDVETMIGRLEARLEAAPGDAKGWRMLGWSHFQLGHYERAVPALERALALDPTSVDLKTALATAKARVAE